MMGQLLLSNLSPVRETLEIGGDESGALTSTLRVFTIPHTF